MQILIYYKFCFNLEGWFLNYLLVLLSAIVLYVATIEVCAVVYVFPVSQCDLNLTPSQKGILGM